MHTEAGYKYIGPESFYRLTVPEIRRLYNTFEYVREREQSEAERQNPDLRKQRVRDSDVQALERFKSERGLH